MAAPDSHSPFPKTKWSIVLESGRGSAKGEAALAELCQAYWLPLYTFARRSGQAPADAEDLVQGFLAKAVNDELFSRADAGRGKLRRCERKNSREQTVKKRLRSGHLNF